MWRGPPRDPHKDRPSNHVCSEWYDDEYPVHMYSITIGVGATFLGRPLDAPSLRSTVAYQTPRVRGGPRQRRVISP